REGLQQDRHRPGAGVCRVRIAAPVGPAPAGAFCLRPLWATLTKGVTMFTDPHAPAPAPVPPFLAVSHDGRPPSIWSEPARHFVLVAARGRPDESLLVGAEVLVSGRAPARSAGWLGQRSP